MQKSHFVALHALLIVGCRLAIAGDVEAPEVRVEAPSLQSHDEVLYSPHSVAIEKNRSDVQVGDTLAKLPGVLVRNASGIGSVTTVISSGALSAGATAVSIDDIPVLDPMGTGVNFSLFPAQLIESIEHHSPFYPNLNSGSDLLSSPGGRISLRTAGISQKNEKRWQGSLTFGSARTLQASGAYRRGDQNQALVLGLSGFNTAGDFSYRNPISGSQEKRMNNSSAGLGGLVKWRKTVGRTGSLELIDLASHSERTNPGPLSMPSRDHQQDSLNLLGARYQDDQAFSPKDGVFAKTALLVSDLGIRSTPSGSTNSGRYDAKSRGHYAQMGYSRKNQSSGFTLALDNQNEVVKREEGAFDRNLLGSSVVGRFDFGPFRVAPLLRRSVSSRFDDSTDGSMSFVYFVSPDDELTVSYGVQHFYPSITANTGFTTSGYTLLANPSLKVQRDSISALSFVRRKQRYTLYATAFHDLILNRATYAFVAFPSSYQYVNVDRVSIVGGMIDVQVFPISQLALRGSLTATRAWNRATGHELPYKPRFETWTAATLTPISWLSFTAQEQFTAKRFTSEVGVDSLSPIAQTHFRIEAAFGQNTVFFKMANAFDAKGFENPDFPFQGRSLWLGYTCEI